MLYVSSLGRRLVVASTLILTVACSQEVQLKTSKGTESSTAQPANSNASAGAPASASAAGGSFALFSLPTPPKIALPPAPPAPKAPAAPAAPAAPVATSSSTTGSNALVAISASISASGQQLGGNLASTLASSNLCVPNGILALPNNTGFSLDWSSKNNCTDLSGAFFQSLGTNGRACVSCHFPTDAWTLNPATVKVRFAASQGQDPLFSPVDGSVCPTADVSTVSARQTAYALLLSKGLIRVELPLAATSDFTVSAATGVYCNTIDLSNPRLSLYRRPLPATNLTFLSSVMFDGRETISDTNINSDLIHQAADATLGHAQAKVAPTAQQLADMVGFETTIFTSEFLGPNLINLSSTPFQATTQVLSNQTFFLNESISPTSNAFTLFNAFANSNDSGAQSIYRGQQIFNTRTFFAPALSGTATCTSCHNTPNVGTDSASPAHYFNIGVADVNHATSDLPLYTLVNSTSGETVQVSDPGRAMITGQWADVGAFKVPGLRGLAARPPYFHNGSASDLPSVVTFYNNEFNIGLSTQDQTDLAAFMGAL